MWISAASLLEDTTERETDEAAAPYRHRKLPCIRSRAEVDAETITKRGKAVHYGTPAA